MGNQEPYKRGWGARARPCVLVMAYPVTLGGGIGLALDFASLTYRRLRHAVRGRW
jgi:hypothetical protein